jgi:CRP-like cAMP-binding protein
MSSKTAVLDILRAISEHASARSYAHDEVIFRQGQPADEGIGFVLRGEVRIVQHQGADGVVLGRVRPGEIFGEAAYILGRSRGATAIAESLQTIVMFFDQASFMAQAGEYFELLKAIWDQTVARVVGVHATMERLREPFAMVVDPTCLRLIAGNQASNLRIPELLGHKRRSYFAEGHDLFTQGQKHDGTLFLLVEGSVSATRHFPNGETREITRFRPGDFLGYEPRSEESSRFFSAVAKDGVVRAVMFDASHFFHLMRDNTELFWIVIRSIVTQLAILDDTLRIAVTRLHRAPGSERAYREIQAALKNAEITPPEQPV